MAVLHFSSKFLSIYSILYDNIVDHIGDTVDHIGDTVDHIGDTVDNIGSYMRYIYPTLVYD